MRCSYLEIYNEEVRDLLAADSKAKCDLKEDPSKGVFVAVRSVAESSDGAAARIVEGWSFALHARATASSSRRVASESSRVRRTRGGAAYQEMVSRHEPRAASS